MSTGESESRKDASGEESSEGGFWSAAGDLDEQVAEEHASKIIALWELGGDFAAMKPAQGSQAEADDDGAWASDAPAPTAAAAPAAEESPLETASAAAAPPASAGQDAGPATASDASGSTSPAPDDTIPEPSPVGATSPQASVIVSEELTSAPPPAQPAAPAPEPRRAPVPVDDAVELPTSSSSRLFLFAGLGVAALLAVIGGVVVFSGPDASDERSTAASAPATDVADTEPGATEQAAESTPSAPAEVEPAAQAAAEPPAAEEPPVAEPAAAEETPAEPAAPTTAVLTVQTEPADATLTLDGRAVSNPYRGELELGSRHQLRAEADGHRDARETVRLDADRAVTLRLAERPSRISASIRRSGALRGAGRGQAARSGRGRATGRSGRSRSGRSGSSGRGAGFVTENPY